MSAWKVAAVFGAAEGMMAVFAAVARKNPREVGWTWVGVSPLIALIPAEGSESTRAGMIAAGVGAAALGIYHIETLSDETISDRDRFWKSFTAHHLAFVAPVVIEALAHRRGRKGKGQSFPEIRPFVDGDSVGMNLRWVH